MKPMAKFALLGILGILISFCIGFLSVDSSTALYSSTMKVNQSTNIYLPITQKNYPWLTTFGSQVENLKDSKIKGFASDSKIQWARMDLFKWAQIEPQNTSPATYKWYEVDEGAIIAANEIGMEVIAIIRTAPSWAQKNPPYVCSPVSETAIPDFAEFVKDLVKRYSAPPYNIKYWELGNEPDVDPSLVSPNSVFGCWGDDKETYYGGEYYAEMLKIVYPEIKSADPESNVLIGGLLLDCDPTHPPKGEDCKSGKFLQGVLRKGGANYFDVMSFHGYALYESWPSGIGGLYNDEHDQKWAHRGGVVMGKVDFLHEMMESYGVDKPIIHTEGSLLCHEENEKCDPPTSEFFDSQSDYVVWLFVRNWANGINATIWYQFDGPGWRYGGLLDENQVPKPAYNAVQFLTSELGSATFQGKVELHPDVVGYEFKTDQNKIWVLWSTDENPHSIMLPDSVKRVLDKFGNEISLSSFQINVNKPIYAEFNN